MKVLILCTGNSCRSQMAHGLLRYFFSDFEVYSAGTKPEPVNSYAIEVMKDIDIDISNNSSNHTDEYIHINFDYVFTVCDSAKEICPIYPYAKTVIHKSFPDPANVDSSDKDKKKVYVDVRDSLKEYFVSFFNS